MQQENPSRWTQGTVSGRLAAAMKVIQRTVTAPRPAGYGSPALAVERDAWDRWFAGFSADLAADRAARNRVRFSASAAEVTAAEEALAWPWRYLAGRVDLLVALNLWLRAHAGRATFASLVRLADRDYETERWRRRRAVILIADGLNADGVPCREPPPREVGTSGLRRVPESSPLPDWFAEAQALARAGDLPAAEALIAERVTAEFEGLETVGNAGLNEKAARRRVTALHARLRGDE